MEAVDMRDIFTVGDVLFKNLKNVKTGHQWQELIVIREVFADRAVYAPYTECGV